MTWSMNRSGILSSIIHPSNVQRQKHVQHGSLIKILHCTSARLSNTTIHSSDKEYKPSTNYTKLTENKYTKHTYQRTDNCKPNTNYTK